MSNSAQLVAAIGRRRAGLALSAFCLAVVLVVAGAQRAGAESVTTCNGSVAAPGVLSGDYSGPVHVVGVCFVNQGPARVHGTLVVTPGGVLVSAFALNDATGTGNSHLTVTGNLVVQTGATLLLGCEPGFFTCLDDPNQQSPTLYSHAAVGGNLIANGALGVVVHASTIAGNVSEMNGGGGVKCDPSGVFAVFHSPVYSDYEDVSIGGALSIGGLTSCWLGVARDHVAHNAWIAHDQLADPDAIEILSNWFGGNLACYDNRRVWDSSEQSFGALFPRTPKPNIVEGTRLGQCVLSSPLTGDGVSGPGPF